MKNEKKDTEISDLYRKMIDQGYAEDAFLGVVNSLLTYLDGEKCSGYNGESHTSKGDKIDPFNAFRAMLSGLEVDETIDDLADCIIEEEREKVVVFFAQGMKEILEVPKCEREELLMRYFCVASMLAFTGSESVLREYEDGNSDEGWEPFIPDQSEVN